MRRRWPLAVALAVVTGRRVDRPEHARDLSDLLALLATGLVEPGEDAPPAAHRRHFSTLRARARLAFPQLVGVDDASLDRHPFPEPGHFDDARAWLAAQVARFGPTVAAAWLPPFGDRYGFRPGREVGGLGTPRDCAVCVHCGAFVADTPEAKRAHRRETCPVPEAFPDE